MQAYSCLMIYFASQKAVLIFYGFYNDKLHETASPIYDNLLELTTTSVIFIHCKSSNPRLVGGRNFNDKYMFEGVETSDLSYLTLVLHHLQIGALCLWQKLEGDYPSMRPGWMRHQ